MESYAIEKELIECNNLAAIYYAARGESVAAKILALESTVAELQSLSLKDHLTGLPNRRMIEEFGARMIESARRACEQVVVVMIDLNGFKLINDRQGHAAGDKLLKTFALTLQSSIRPQDMCGRLGGDEFVVILSGADQTITEAVMERFKAGLQGIVGFSWGSYIGLLSLEEMMWRADESMYVDKRSTKGSLDLIPS